MVIHSNLSRAFLVLIQGKAINSNPIHSKVMIIIYSYPTHSYLKHQLQVMRSNHSLRHILLIYNLSLLSKPHWHISQAVAC
jgi:hypothetical protein